MRVACGCDDIVDCCDWRADGEVVPSTGYLPTQVNNVCDGGVELAAALTRWNARRNSRA